MLEGSVRKVGDKVRITVQLIDVPSQGHLWSEDYDRDLRDSTLFATQSDISERVAEALHVRLAGTDSAPGRSRTAGELETYNLYLKGRYYSQKTSPEGLKKAITYFQQAIARSPADARAWAGLAEAAPPGWAGTRSFHPPSRFPPRRLPRTRRWH